MAFQPRFNAPVGTEKWWNPPSRGGVNPCITRPNGSNLPNCVGYAWGRFMEIIGEPRPGLSANSPASWMADSKSYEQGQTPKLGAAILWSGHVAIVEQINDDGSIVTSNSGFPNTWFWTEKHYPPKYACDSGGTFLGFIYNPGGGGGSSPSDVFVSSALSAVGKPRDWAVGASGIDSKTGGWSALAIVAISKQVKNIKSNIVPKTNSIEMMVSVGVSTKIGEFRRGNFFDIRVVPKPGDLILFRYGNKKNYATSSPYSGDKIGIVTDYKDSKVTFVMGDSENSIKKHEVSVDNVCISGYYRPLWDKITENSKVVEERQKQLAASGGVFGQLYSELNTEEDASIREVSYLTTTGQPSLKSTNIKLSVINYTSALSAIITNFSGAGMPDEATVDFTKLKNNKAKAIGEYLESNGLTPAQIAGILANISKDSKYETNHVNQDVRGIGICEWTSNRRTEMVKAVGKDWQNNLTGQLNFMWSELNGPYKSALKGIQEVNELTADAAKECAEIFCKKYESVNSTPLRVAQRRGEANSIWHKIVTVPVTSGTTTPNNGVIKTRSGQVRTVGKEIVIPSSVAQSGVTPNYTNYTYFSVTRGWGNPSYQYTLAKYWKEDGLPSDRNIATIGGYYLMAVVLRIGTVGDLLTVVLDDGTSFNAIVGDSKGGDSLANARGGSVWGHTFGYNGLVDVIEWEKKGSPLSQVDNDTKIDLTGWEGKKVKKFINYGSYFD